MNSKLFLLVKKGYLFEIVSFILISYLDIELFRNQIQTFKYLAQLN